jgi:phage shock protein PspC (stress-responsive transcriptional regulator)
MAGKLHRSSSNRIIAGVCGGIADWLGWSPTLVRVLYVVGSIISVAFPGLLVYLILWIVMPKSSIQDTRFKIQGLPPARQRHLQLGRTADLILHLASGWVGGGVHLVSTPRCFVPNRTPIRISSANLFLPPPL